MFTQGKWKLTLTHKKLMFLEDLLITAQHWNKNSGEWENKLWYLHLVACYRAMERNKILKHTIAEMNLKHITLNKEVRLKKLHTWSHWEDLLEKTTPQGHKTNPWLLGHGDGGGVFYKGIGGWGGWVMIVVVVTWLGVLVQIHRTLLQKQWLFLYVHYTSFFFFK